MVHTMKLKSDVLRNIINEVAAVSEASIYIESTGDALWVKAASEGRYLAIGTPVEGPKWGITINPGMLTPHLKGVTDSTIEVPISKSKDSPSLIIKCGRTRAELSTIAGTCPKEPRRENGQNISAKTSDTITKLLSLTALSDVFNTGTTEFVHIEGTRREVICGRGDTLHIALAKKNTKGYDGIKIDAPYSALISGARVARGETFTQSLRNNYQAYNDWFCLHLQAPQPDKLIGIDRMKTIAQKEQKVVAQFTAPKAELSAMVDSCAVAADGPFTLTIDKKIINANVKSDAAKIRSSLEPTSVKGSGSFNIDSRLFLDLLATVPQDSVLTWCFSDSVATCNYEHEDIQVFLCLLLST